MRRSYLHIKANDFQIYHNEKIYDADSIIINVYDASILFANFEKFKKMFARLLEKNIKIYLEIDCDNLKKSYKALDLIIGKYIGGFYIDNPEPKVLRRLSLKARDYELKQKLNYQTLDFFVVIDDLGKFVRLRKIIKNPRVTHALFKDIEGVDQEYYQKKITYLEDEWQLDIVDEAKITNNPSLLAEINNHFSIDYQKIEDALIFIRKVKTASKKEKKLLLAQDGLVRNYRILNLAKRLQLIDTFPKINFYKRKKKEKIIKAPRIKNFYTLGEEIGNAITHGVGAGLSIAALVLLIIKAAKAHNGLALFSYIVFSLSSLLLYLASTIYHSLSLGTKAKALFQKFDHLTIYLLIAGTYTPFSLLAISGTTGIIVCIILWIGALIGSLMTIFAFGKFRIFHIILYLVLGWIAIFFISDIISYLEPVGLILLLAGGVTYTLGIIFYGMKFFKYTHMVWHIFVIVGTVLHFLSILLYL